MGPDPTGAGRVRAERVALSHVEHHFAPAGASATTSPLVFLHEGLGSVSRWKTFPWEVRRALGDPATLIYSRFGYGHTPARSEVELPASSWLQHEATSILPQLVAAAGFDAPLLIGHSDGATIAALHAAAGFTVSGLVLIAPHVFLEPVTVDGVRRASLQFQEQQLLDRLAAHHDDPAGTVTRWCEAWLAPEMQGWTIASALPNVRVPVLTIQGSEDAYGTAAHVDAIRRLASGPVESLYLDGVGHEPHLESAQAVVKAIAAFVRGHALQSSTAVTGLLGEPPS